MHGGPGMTAGTHNCRVVPEAIPWLLLINPAVPDVTINIPWPAAGTLPVRSLRRRPQNETFIEIFPLVVSSSLWSTVQ